MTSEITALPEGVRVRELDMHPDGRGVFTELFRVEWDTGVRPIQWNAVASEAGVLRGVHVHVAHDDYLVVVAGRAAVGLRDLRRGSPTQGLATVVDMPASRMRAITIPHGVAHGFLFLEPSIHIYSVTHYWDPADELGCHWADPALDISWPAAVTSVSDRDAAAQPLSALLDELEPFQPIGASLS